MLVYFNLTSITNVVKSLLLTRGDPGGGGGVGAEET